MRLTPEQEQVIETARDADVLKVIAFAGTGKTTTLEALARAYPRRRFLYLAFNRSVAREGRGRMPRNVSVMTTHGLAFRYWKQKRSSIDLEGVRAEYRPMELAELLPGALYREEAFLLTTFMQAWLQSALAEITPKSLTALLLQNPSLDGLLKRAFRQGAFGGDVTRLVVKMREVWEAFLRGKIPATHAMYLKLYQLEGVPTKTYDMILLDEAQDTNEVTFDLLARHAQRRVFVGDPHQQIYSFRGSVNAFKMIGEAPTCYLTRSWRLNPKVAGYASHLLWLFKGEGRSLQPGHNERNRIGQVAYLGRTNAALIRQISVMLGSGCESFELTRPADEIFGLPLAIQQMRRYWRNKKKPHLDASYRWLMGFDSEKELEQYADEIDDKELLGGLLISRMMAKDLVRLHKACKEIKGKQGKKPFVLSTAHTAKGLEWDRVVLLDDFPDLFEVIAEAGFVSRERFLKALDAPMSRPAAIQAAEEVNLAYVAVTRARKMLDIRSTLGLALECGSEAAMNRYLREGLARGLKKSLSRVA